MSEAALIRDIIDVQIVLDTNAVTRSSFGTPLFIGTTDPTPGAKVASYANLEEVADVYDVADPEYLAAQAFFSQNPRPNRLLIGYKDGTETYVEALADIRAINDDWFFLTAETRLKADILALAAAVAAIPGLRQSHFVTNEAATLDSGSTTATAVELAALNIEGAALYYHSDEDLFPEMAALGRVAVQRESGNLGPGSATLFYQPVQGITGDSFTSTQRSLLETRKVNYFQTLANNTRVFGGKMSGGEWFDVMYFAAWLQARVAENVTELLTRAADRGEKIPYTDQGIGQVSNKIAEVLDIGVRFGAILETSTDADGNTIKGYTITAPTRAQTTFADRTNRVLNGVSFVANLAGAIKTAQIRGTLVA